MNEKAIKINFKSGADNILNTAKRIITEEIEKAGYKVEDIYLFGSRARGDYKDDSDWDFFVIVDKDISAEDESRILLNCRRLMAKLNISNDIIISSKIELNENNNVGNITYYALKYGVRV
ncbi:MAG: nucleotidyltransferase domain-containing protein [bacterium]